MSNLSSRRSSSQEDVPSIELEVTPYPRSSRSSPNSSPFKWRQKTSQTNPTLNQKIPVPYGSLLDGNTLNILTNNFESAKQKNVTGAPLLSKKQSFYKKKPRSTKQQMKPISTLDQMIEQRSNLPPQGSFSTLSTHLRADSRPNLRSFAPRHTRTDTEYASSKSVKNFRGNSCTFCSEPLENLLINENVTERLVEFTCGHASHEECYRVASEFASTQDEIIAELDETSPQVEVPSELPKCKCGKQAVPLDGGMSELSQKLLNVSTKVLTSHINDSRRNFSPSTGRTQLPTSNLKNLVEFVPSHARRTSRGSSVSAMSSIISSISRSPTPSPTSAYNPRSFAKGSDQMSLNSRVPLALMRSRIISNLLESCSESLGDSKDISESFVDSLGLLRLLDTLLISFTIREKPKAYHCYLFSYLLLLIDESFNKFRLIPLVEEAKHRLSNSKVPIRITDMASLALKVKFGQRDEIFLSADTFILLDKWRSAFNHLDLFFSNENITHTIAVDAVRGADPVYMRIPFQTARGKLGLGRLDVLKTSHGMYAKAPPKSVILIINLLRTSQLVTNILKNIIKALFLIKIDVLLIFSCNATLEIDSEYISQKFFSFTYDEEKYDAFWENPDINVVQRNDGETIASLCRDYLKTTKHNNIYVSTVTISNLPIGAMTPLTQNNLLLEIGVLHNSSTTKKTDVISIASWDEVMEKICSNVNLDFDTINTSEAETENELGIFLSKVESSTLTLHENSSTTSTTTESDSDADVISTLLAGYGEVEENIQKTPLLQQTGSFDDHGDSFIDGIDTSFLTPKLRQKKPETDGDQMTGGSPRWSALLHDIDKALEESHQG